MKKIFVIAEIGINHNGDLDLTKQLINMAVRCKCDAIKFQKRTIDLVYSKEFLDAPRGSPWGTTQREQKEGLEFGHPEYDEINQYCNEAGIPWFASAWDIPSQDFLAQYDLKYNKVASRMVENHPLLDKIAREGKHTFISTGHPEQDHIDIATTIFEQYDCPFTLLHCVMKYPCPANECNLRRIQELKERYACPVGYSSHYPGLLDKTIAMSLGAEVIETHITMDRTMYGTDQPASLEERGLYLVTRDAQKMGEML